MGVGPAGRERQRAAQALGGFPALPLFAPGDAAVAPGADMARIFFQRAGERRFRLFDGAGCQQDVAEIELDFGMIGGETRGFARARRCLVDSSRVLERDREIRCDFGRFGRQFGGPFVAGDRFFQLSLRLERVAERCEGRQKRRVNGQRRAIGGDGFVEVSGGPAAFAEMEAVDGVAGGERRRFGDELRRALGPAELEGGKAEQMQRLGVARRALQDFPVGVAGLLQLSGAVPFERRVEPCVRLGLARVRPRAFA
ncbi:MAG TPA: hypothetical protein VIG92_07785 [Rhodospirillales bacterium]